MTTIFFVVCLCYTFCRLAFYNGVVFQIVTDNFLNLIVLGVTALEYDGYRLGAVC